MSNRIQCYTLFDITKTGIRQRTKVPDNMATESYINKRNTQANFDTILQVIGLRSQPEFITDPVCNVCNLNEIRYFGFLYNIDVEACNVYSFYFNIQHESVFDDGEDKFGYLYNDCCDIPMIQCPNTHKSLTQFLDISPELRNIYVEFI